MHPSTAILFPLEQWMTLLMPAIMDVLGDFSSLHKQNLSVMEPLYKCSCTSLIIQAFWVDQNSMFGLFAQEQSLVDNRRRGAACVKDSNNVHFPKTQLKVIHIPLPFSPPQPAYRHNSDWSPSCAKTSTTLSLDVLSYNCPLVILTLKKCHPSGPLGKWGLTKW